MKLSSVKLMQRLPDSLALKSLSKRMKTVPIMKDSSLVESDTARVSTAGRQGATTVAAGTETLGNMRENLA